MKIAFGFVSAFALVLTGCVTTNASMLGASTEKRSEIRKENVALYLTADKVPGDYEEVALLNAAGSSGFTSEAGMIDSMKKKAGKVGANAIILDALSEPSAGAKVAAAVFGVSAERKGKAVAIFVYPTK